MDTKSHAQDSYLSTIVYYRVSISIWFNIKDRTSVHNKTFPRELCKYGPEFKHLTEFYTKKKTRTNIILCYKSLN